MHLHFQRYWVRLLATLVLALTPTATPTYADTVAEFYKGKTLTLIVGYNAGGGFDIYARILAGYLSKYIPGQPRIVVQNMPGAGSLRAASHVYNASPRDGTVISLTRAPVIAPLLGSTGGPGFEASKFTWLGSGASDLRSAHCLEPPRSNRWPTRPNTRSRSGEWARAPTKTCTPRSCGSCSASRPSW